MPASLTADALFHRDQSVVAARTWLEQGDPKLCTVLLLFDWLAASAASQDDSLAFLRYIKAVYADGNACKRPLLPLPPAIAINALVDCTAQEAVTILVKHLRLDVPVPAPLFERTVQPLTHLEAILALLEEKDASLVSREKALSLLFEHYFGSTPSADDVARFVRAEPEVVIEDIFESHRTVIGVNGMLSSSPKKHHVRDLFKNYSSTSPTCTERSDASMTSPRARVERLRNCDAPDTPSTSSSAEATFGVPFTNLQPVKSGDNSTSDPLPDTINQLSRHDKRRLVQRSQKLNKVLGVPIEEMAVPDVLVDLAPVDRVRTNSTTMTISPLHSAQAGGSPLRSTISKEWRKMSIPGQPDYYFEEFPPPHAAISQSREYTALGMTPSVAREQRRRKLDKLHRLLGEHVPPDVALNAASARCMSSANHRPDVMVRSKSSLGGVWDKIVHSSRRKHVGPHLNAPSDDMLLSTGYHDSDESRQERIGTNRTDRPSSWHEGSILGDAGTELANVSAVNGLNKARKLEQVFGDLPPSSLFLPRPEHRRTRSHQGISPDSRRFSNRTMSTYRSSIVSLHYLAENDPDALARLTSDYIRRSHEELPLTSPFSIGSDSATNSSRVVSPSSSTMPLVLSDSDAEIPPAIPRRHDRNVMSSRETQYSSNSSARQVISPTDDDPDADDSDARAQQGRREVTPDDTKASPRRSHSLDRIQSQAAKRAQKLASFFGTTKGEVWNMLLDDLQTAIEEEDDVDEDERKSVLDLVQRLRQPVHP